LRKKITNNSKERQPAFNWEWIKVSLSLVTTGFICFVLIGNISSEKNDYQEINQAGSIYYEWHNLEIKPILSTSDMPPMMKFDEIPKILKYYKHLDLKESQRLADFKIMRPSFDINLPLELSCGIIKHPPSHSRSIPLKNFKGPVTYYDIWHKGMKLVYVRQFLNKDTQKLLNEKKEKVIMKIRSNTNIIPFRNRDAIAIPYVYGKDDKGIRMFVKNKNEQVIYFEIRGNVGEGELFNLAKSYIEK
jgi:hypothetical protein